MRHGLHGRRLLLLFFAAAFGASCADTEGTDPYGMWTVDTDPSGEFTFRYLSPPWTRVDAADPVEVIAAVEPTEAFLDGDVIGGSVQARFKAVVSRADGRAADAVLEDAARFEGAGADSFEIAPLDSGEGYPGVQLTAVLSDRNVRSVYRDLPAGGVAIMRIVGREPIVGEDFTLMLRGVEPRSSGGGQ